MIRKLCPADFDSVMRVILDAAQAYRGVIPDDRWKEQYMSAEELRGELDAGVQFYGWFEEDSLMGVMGIQPIKDTALNRHSYVLHDYQRRGIGGLLLKHLLALVKTPDVLVGTWEDAAGAIHFYEHHGFTRVSRRETDLLLRKYWQIPERQIATSVVLKINRQNSPACG